MYLKGQHCYANCLDFNTLSLYTGHKKISLVLFKFHEIALQFLQSVTSGSAVQEIRLVTSNTFGNYLEDQNWHLCIHLNAELSGIKGTKRVTKYS
jgi:hypothetical protein